MTSTAFAINPLQRFNEQRARQRIEWQVNLPQLFTAIDQIPAATGAGVIFIDHEFNMVQLRPFSPVCRRYPLQIILREPPRYLSAQNHALDLKTSRRESKLVGEAVGTALSCGAAVLGWIVVFGSGAAVPITGGTSAAITYLGIAAATASTVQCVNGGYRTAKEYSDPEGLDALDSQEWYANMSTALDVISLAGAAAAGAATIRMVHTLRRTTGKSTRDVLNGLSRQERKRLTDEVNRLNHPGTSAARLRELTRSGALPKRYGNAQLSHSIQLQLKDAIGATLSFAGSALTGTIKTLAIGFYEELSNEMR